MGLVFLAAFMLVTFLYACVCVWYVCMLMCVLLVHMCLHVETRGWCQVSSAIAAHFICWGKVSYWTIELAGSVSLTSQLASGTLFVQLSTIGITGWLPCLPGFYIGVGDLDFHPHSCLANALSTEPFPNPMLSIVVLLKCFPRRWYGV